MFVKVEKVELVFYGLLKRQLQRGISVSAEHLLERLPVTLASLSHAWKQLLDSELLHPLQKEQLKTLPSVYAISKSLKVSNSSAYGPQMLHPHDLISELCCGIKKSFLGRFISL